VTVFGHALVSISRKPVNLPSAPGFLLSPIPPTLSMRAVLCRAAENTCYFATVNFASDGSPTTSAVVKPDGTLLSYQPYGKEGCLSRTSTFLRRRGCSPAVEGSLKSQRKFSLVFRSLNAVVRIPISRQIGNVARR